MRVDRVILKIEDSVRQILQALNKRLTVWDNWDIQEVTVANTGTANVDFIVQHNLGRIPTYYFYNISVGGVVYDGDRTVWTTTTMTLKCTVPNAALSLIVM